MGINHERLDQAALGLTLLALLGVAVSQVHSFDIFWQLHSGRHILETREFIYFDTFSLAAEAPRFEHCWLHDLIFYCAYVLGGYGGISLLKGGLVTAVAAVLAAAARVRGASWWAVAALAPSAVLLGRGGWLERPQLWSFLFFALFVLILELHRSGRGRVVFALVPLMVVWANLHAGSVLAFPVVGAYLAGGGGAMLCRRSALPSGGYRNLWLAAAGVAVAALATPYGLQLLQTLLEVPRYGITSGAITQIYNMDWRPTTFARDPLFFYAVGFVALLVLAGWRQLSWTDLFLLAGLAVMGLKLSRHTSFFFFAIGALGPRYADAVLQAVTQRAAGVWRALPGLVARVAAVALFLYLFLPAYKTYGMFSTGLRTWHYPIEAADFVAAERLPGNLYNTYDWGGYLMWTLYPDYRVFWDGRSDSEEMFSLGLQVMSGHSGWEDILDRFSVNTVITKACTVDTGQRYPVIDRLRQSPDWALVFADESSLVFVRRTSVDASWLARYRLPDHRVDDTILAEARLLTQVNPGRYKGFWEMADIYMKRKEYPLALRALKNYLVRSPVRDPRAERYYRMLVTSVGKRAED